MKKLFLLALLAALFASCANENDSPMDYKPEYDGLSNGEPANGENYEEYAENPFVFTSEEPTSTFSVDADGGAYANTRRQLNQGHLPYPASVRIEEYLNYFMFDYLTPTDGENIALNSEISTCPWTEENHIIRLGIKGRELKESERTSSNYVMLVDVSGSMSGNMELLKTGFCRMVDALSANDYVAIATYSGSARAVMQSTQATEANKEIIKQTIRSLESGGSTAGAAGIEVAYNLAKDNFIEGGNNRVVLISDGDFNVGRCTVEELEQIITEKRSTGIYLTTIGMGYGNYNDAMMERLANKGNGTYEYIDCAEEVERIFIENYDRFYAIANDTKIQINFNPAMVERYRLIGYENRMMSNEDFERDSVDAGEIGASQTITALYEVTLTDSAQLKNEEYLRFDVRYKIPGETTARPVTHSLISPPSTIETASANMRFAASVAAFGLILRQSQYRGNASYSMIYDLSEGVVSFDPYGRRNEFYQLVDKAESLE